jgi:hypothetical protein
MADQSKLCSLTNNTGKDVVVALIISDDETASQDAVISANQQFEILKTSAGNTIIKNGSSDTVALDHNYKDGADETGYVQNYDLIVSDSNWFYPLADLSVIQQGSNGTASYAAQTVDATNQAAIDQAFGFYQTIAAYPSSLLATDYMHTLLQAQNAAAANADGSPGSAEAVANVIENTMNSFFKGTDQYKDVMLADIVAVDNYYNNFPCVWAQYHDSITYYLYGSDGTTAVFSGTLSLVKPGVVDITKPNAGYTCSFAPAVNPADTSKTDVDATRSVSLTYNGGMFLDNVTVDIPAIGLKGSFQLERPFTDDPNNNAVIVILTGTVNGVTCIGFDSPQPAPAKTTSLQTSIPIAMASSPAAKYWDTLIHPKSQRDTIVSILTLVGAILLIPATAFAIYGIYRIVKYKLQVKETASKEEIETAATKLTEAQRGKIISKYLKFSAPDSWLDFKTLSDATILSLQEETEEHLNGMKRNRMEMAFRMQKDCLLQAQKYSEWLDRPTLTLIQDSLRFIKDSVYNILQADPEALPSFLPDAYANFSKVQVNLNQINTAVNAHLEIQEKEMMKKNMTDSAAMFEGVKQLIEKEKEDETETNPKISEEIEPIELK